jgi:hypothetical protein
MRRLVVLITLFCVAMPVAAASGDARSGRQVVRDCVSDGTLDRRWSSQDIKDGLAELPTDIDEYTDCRAVLEEAYDSALAREKRREASGGGSGGSGGGSDTDGGGGIGGSDSGGTGTGSEADVFGVTGEAGPTADEQSALDEAAQSGGQVGVDGGSEEPGGPGLAQSYTTNSFPVPLIVALVLLVLAALGGLAYALRRRVPFIGNAMASMGRSFSGLRTRVPGLGARGSGGEA